MTTGTAMNDRSLGSGHQVLQVQQSGGVVILRLFHEAGGTWFWWSKGLRGIIWLIPYDGAPQASFYPGKDFVDIAGADNYNAAVNYAPMTSIFNATQAIAGPTIPIALHENGPIPDPDQLQSTGTWTAPFPETGDFGGRIAEGECQQLRDQPRGSR